MVLYAAFPSMNIKRGNTKLWPCCSFLGVAWGVLCVFSFIYYGNREYAREIHLWPCFPENSSHYQLPQVSNDQPRKVSWELKFYIFPMVDGDQQAPGTFCCWLRCSHKHLGFLEDSLYSCLNGGLFSICTLGRFWVHIDIIQPFSGSSCS